MLVDDVRRLIPTVQSMVYLNTGWSGPSPTPVLEEIRSWLEYEVREGPATRPVYTKQTEKREEVRGAVARLLHASPEEVVLTQNTTEGINLVLNGLDWYQGDEVLTLNVEHPSVMVPCLFLERRRGARLSVVRLDPQDGKTAILEKINRSLTPRTRLVVLSHISYCTGLRLPLTEIRDLIRSRAKAALILVDGAQAVGQIEVDVHSLGCDFYALSGHKWLMGPQGTGALYVRKEMVRQLEPTYVGGAAAKSWSVEGSLEPNRDSINKFRVSTVNTPLLAGLQTAIEFQDRFGRAEIETRSRMLGERLREKLLQISRVYLESPPEPQLRCGLLNFGIKAVSAAESTGALWMHHHVVGRTIAAPDSTQLSLHYFNTEQEVDRVAAVIDDMANQDWDHDHDHEHYH